MAKIRVGFSSDFNVSGQKVGFGTANPTALLEVAGSAKADFNITGVTTLTSYGGFVAQNQNITEPTTIKRTTSKSGTLDSVNERETGFTELGGVHHGDDQNFNTLSEDLVVEDGKIFSIHNTEMVGSTTIGEQDPHTHASHVSAGSLEQVSVTGHFSVPCGGINERQETPIEGTVRFNDDLNTLEFFNGVEWRQFTYNQGQSGRAVVAGGYNAPAAQSHMGYVQISTLGNSMYFGDLSTAQYHCGAHGNETRGIISAGPGDYDLMQYITIASAGNAINFGDLIQDRAYTTCTGSSTRKLTAGGYLSPTSRNEIEYVEISTTGNALDFGDLSQMKYGLAGMSSPTRGIFAGGYGNTALAAGMDYIAIASKGNGIDFGDPSTGHAYPAQGSNGVRGIIAGGVGNYPSGQTPNDVIDYVNIGSLGNAVNFGNLTRSKRLLAGASSNIRMVIFNGGTAVPSPNASLVNEIDYLSISTGGQAQDFGDTTGKDVYDPAALSDSHGGLGGF